MTKAEDIQTLEQLGNTNLQLMIDGVVTIGSFEYE